MLNEQDVLEELKRLQDEFANSAGQIAPAVRQRVGNKHVWEIPLPNRAPVFMSQDVHCVDTSRIVHVDARKLYFHWLCTTQYGLGENCVLLEDMPKDVKYRDASRGFSHGKKNPVPLADVSGYLDDGYFGLGFSNGVTRTFWLLANGARTFPVHTYQDRSADLLNKFTGIGADIIVSSELA